MTQFDLSPGFAKLQVFDGHRTHYQTLPISTPTGVAVGDDPTIGKKGGGTIAFSAAMIEYAAVYKTFLPPQTTIVEASFWSKPTVDDDPIWIFSHPLTVVGTGSTGASYKQEIIQSYRTQLGHILKLYLGPVAADYPNDNVHPLTTADAMAAYVLGSTSVIVGRDGAFAIGALKSSSKTNDKWRKLELGI